MTIHSSRKLLAVGPLPPPYGGTTVSFMVFRDEVERQFENIELTVIDTSQKQLKKSHAIISAGNLSQALTTIRQFAGQIRQVDEAIIFGSNGFQLSLMPILLIMARFLGKPTYIRPFGGSLDVFVQRQNPILRWWVLRALKSANGLIVETDLLRQAFVDLAIQPVHLVPGYRHLTDDIPPAFDVVTGSIRPGDMLRLVFVGHVNEDKGVLVVLEAMKRLHKLGEKTIICDIFGPIYHGFEERFNAAVDATPNVHYGGVLEPKDVTKTLRNYDALLFPTSYQGEGHPGVVIEGLMAGIPAITTDFRSIPEVIQNEFNGLLVPTHDPQAVVDAILQIDMDRELLKLMKTNAWKSRTAYDADKVIPNMMDALNMSDVALRAQPELKATQ